LKLPRPQTPLVVVRVAPRTGAWIETDYPKNYHEVDEVAPRTGAWIET